MSERSKLIWLAATGGGKAPSYKLDPKPAKRRAPRLQAGTPSEGMVRTEHGWARPCAACGSTDFGKPCPNTEDGFHVAGTASEDTG